MFALLSNVFCVGLAFCASIACAEPVWAADSWVWQDAVSDGPLLQSFWVVLITSILFWGVGLLGQRMNNRFELDDHNVPAPGVWVRLLGITPESDRLYLRYGFIQVVGIVYLISGLVVMGINETPDYDTVTAACFILFSVGVFVFIVLDIGGRFKKSESTVVQDGQEEMAVSPVPATEQTVTENPQ